MATMVGLSQRYDPADGETCDWPALMHEHRAIARRALRSVLGACREEEDLLQEVALRLVARVKAPGEISLSAWSWRVARNVAVDHLRKRAALPTETLALDRPVGDGLDEAVIASEFAGAVEAAVQRLPERQRDTVVAHAAFEGQRGGHAVVAGALGVSPKAVESILGRARRSLRLDLDLPLGAGVVAACALLRRLIGGKRAALALLAGAALATGAGIALIPSWLPGPPPRPSPAPLQVGPGRPAPSIAPRMAPTAGPAGSATTSAPAGSATTSATPGNLGAGQGRAAPVAPSTVAATVSSTVATAAVTVTVPGVAPVTIPSRVANAVPPVVAPVAGAVGQAGTSLLQGAGVTTPPLLTGGGSS